MFPMWEGSGTVFVARETGAGSCGACLPQVVRPYVRLPSIMCGRALRALPLRGFRKLPSWRTERFTIDT